MTFADVNDFPDYDDVDSRTILDGGESFSYVAADFNAEPDDHDEPTCQNGEAV